MLQMTYSSSQNIHIYLNDALNFLLKEQWIYNYPNTHILVNEILHNFHEDWLPHLKNLSNEEINNIPFGYIDSKWPESLKLLLESIFKLNMNFICYEAKVREEELPIKIHANSKKTHEIVSLAALINEKCQKENIAYIVDAGAGLGYLSQLLYKQYGYKVLAIEGDVKHYETALKNQELHYPDSKEFVVYLNHFITRDMVNDLKSLLHQHFPDWNESKICIVGLHACADLSVTILELYSKLDFVQSMVAMPCCYHRLELHSTEEGERFVNFPVSNALVSLYIKLQGEYFLRRPFLRLGCQQSRHLWKQMTLKDHEKHYKSCIYRAIIQEVAEKENLTIRRLKRRTGKFKVNSDLRIEDYIDNLKNTHELIEKKGGNELSAKKINDKEFEYKIFETWARYRDSCFLVEVLTAFQTAIENICENIVLLDRVAFLQERGFQCDIYKVTNEQISPQCNALVANKV